MRQDRTRSLLILAAKIAGAVALVLVIVIVRPFVDSGPSSRANLDTYATGFKNPTFVGFAPGERVACTWSNRTDGSGFCSDAGSVARSSTSGRGL